MSWFHIGDKVICVKSNKDSAFTINKVYEVGAWKDNGDSETWNIIVDDTGKHKLVNHELLAGCFMLYERIYKKKSVKDVKEKQTGWGKWTK